MSKTLFSAADSVLSLLITMIFSHEAFFATPQADTTRDRTPAVRHFFRRHTALPVAAACCFLRCAT
jgi:hypothetical protein